MTATILIAFTTLNRILDYSDSQQVFVAVIWFCVGCVAARGVDHG
jgi:hypothetical protein